MNLHYREIHRAEIKRLMYREVDRRWDALYGLFSVSIILAIFGVKICLITRPGTCVIGFFIILLGALFYAIYRWLYRTLRNQGNTREWLKPRDQLIIAIIIGLSIVLEDYISGMWFLVFLMAGAYGTWRLWQYSRPHWRIYYFRAGRKYFRELKSYRSNKAVKRDAP
jgi:predicted membrane channel-forming protein YqfA (hemolysin III family)